VSTPAFAVELMFQSTRPVRGATSKAREWYATDPVSIHAPREGRDINDGRDAGVGLRFQSTRPVRGATKYFCAASSHMRCFNPRAP